jgi:hypothetical protein
MTDRVFGSFARFAMSFVLIMYGTTRTPFTPSAYAGARKGSTAC